MVFGAFLERVFISVNDEELMRAPLPLLDLTISIDIFTAIKEYIYYCNSN